ncbi:MAG TPA: hypothetical protein VGN13_07140 [Solirubrobacteraceae bacterium]|jgi:hypothetical protein
MSNEVIGAMVLAGGHSNVNAIHAFVRVVRRMRWSSRPLTRGIQSYAGSLRILAGLAPPHLCDDVKACAAGGFKTLPPSTTHFAPLFMAHRVSGGEQPARLRALEQPATRALARRAARLEQGIADFEARAVEDWGDIMDTIGLWP